MDLRKIRELAKGFSAAQETVKDIAARLATEKAAVEPSAT